MRSILNLAAVLCVATCGTDVAAESGVESPVSRLLEQRCFSCHDAANRRGGLDLTALPEQFDTPATNARWVRIHDRVLAGEMPPASEPPVPTEEKGAFLEALSQSLINAEAERRKGSGRAGLRRLNRDEFENSLRDLLHIPGLDVKDLIPDDGRMNGFTKAGAALDIGPIQLAKYGEAIDKALDLAISPYSVPPEVDHRMMYANQQYDFQVLMSGGDSVMLKDRKYDPRFPIPSGRGNFPEPQFIFGGKYPGLGEASQGGVFREPATVGMFRTLDESFQGRFHWSPVHAGRYTLRFSTWSFWWDRGELKPAARSGALGVYLGDQLVGHYTAPSLHPVEHEVQVWIDPKPRQYIKVDPASLWPIHLYFRQGQCGEYTGPGVAIDYMFVEGPLHDEWPPASHRSLFDDLPIVPFSKLPAEAPRPKRTPPQQWTHDCVNGAGRIVFGTVVPDNPAGSAVALSRRFLTRAFRRPVSDDEVETYARIANERLTAGDCFEDAMRYAFKAGLTSPEFLYLLEPVGVLDDWSLASRLSHFLWNSTPDDSLRALAEKRALNTDAVLAEQVQRMLVDPKGERFIADFLDQWLDLRDIDATTPDRTLYPEFQPYLKESIRQEPRRYFRKLLHDDHPAAELVASTFLMVNQRLAEHYGLQAGPSGANFQLTGINGNDRRGGLLTCAAVLKVTANGTTSSPVKRGAWVMRKLLGQPPQPPPPNIAAVEPDVRGTTTIREQLAQHRNVVSCAACHATMDPPGFALESYDVIGGWRVRYRATAGADLPDFDRLFVSHRNPDGKFPTADYHVPFRMGLPVDPSGQLADGRPFADITEFRALLLGNPRQLARNFVNQLVMYATGEPVAFADRAEVERILDQAGPAFRLRTLMVNVVRSPLFREK